MAIRVTVNTKDADKLISDLQKAVSPQKVDEVVDFVANKARAELVEKTPQSKLGPPHNTQNAWQVRDPGQGQRVVFNDNKVMLFLEEGTRAHGPVRAKFLYIPLRRRAKKGWNKSLIRGKDYILRKRVKGIDAMHIVRDHLPEVRKDFLQTMRNVIRKARRGIG